MNEPNVQALQRRFNTDAVLRHSVFMRRPQDSSTQSLRVHAPPTGLVDTGDYASNTVAYIKVTVIAYNKCNTHYLQHWAPCPIRQHHYLVSEVFASCTFYDLMAHNCLK